MAKMPKNDNLVMESIEDLFHQADSVSETEHMPKEGVTRTKRTNLPIIGAVPVHLDKENAQHGASALVLAGQKRPLSDRSETFLALTSLKNKPKAETKEAEQPRDPGPVPDSENPLLAIRQAVISAGEGVQPDYRPETTSSDPSLPSQKMENFADQIAHLIDREIETRLKAQLSILQFSNHPVKQSVSGQVLDKKSNAKKPAPSRALKHKKNAKTAPAKAARPKKTGTKKKAAKPKTRS